MVSYRLVQSSVQSLIILLLVGVEVTTGRKRMSSSAVTNDIAIYPKIKILNKQIVWALNKITRIT